MSKTRVPPMRPVLIRPAAAVLWSKATSRYRGAVCLRSLLCVVWLVIWLGTPVVAQEWLSGEQLLAVKQSRSLLAESALAISLEGSGQITRIFGVELLGQVKDKLTSAAKTLSNTSTGSTLMYRAMGAVEARDGSALEEIAKQLLAIEQANESAL